MFEYVLHRVVCNRNGVKEDTSFKERVYDDLNQAIMWMEYNKKLDARLYSQFGYYIEHRIKLEYDDRRN